MKYPCFIQEPLDESLSSKAWVEIPTQFAFHGFVVLDRDRPRMTRAIALELQLFVTNISRSTAAKVNSQR